MHQSLDPGASMSDSSTIRSWLDESKRFVLPLAVSASTSLHTCDIGGHKDCGTTVDIRSTLKAMQEWISANPCPDRTVRAQLEVVAGRYGFLALIVEPKREGSGQGGLTDDQMLLGERIDATNVRLLALIAEVEKGLEGNDIDEAHR